MTGAAVLAVAETQFILLPRDDIGLGRSASSGETPDIEISCQLVSRVKGGLRLCRSENGWRVERRGGANSVFVDDAYLEVGHGRDLDRLDQGVILSLGGPSDPSSPGDCRIRLKACGPDRSVVRCSVDLTHLQGRVSGDLERHWPGWREDQAKVWVMFTDCVDIGDGEEAAIGIGPANPGELGTIQARLRYDDFSGYRLEPVGGDIAIDGFKTGGNAPMRDGTVIQLGSTRMTFNRAGGN